MTASKTQTAVLITRKTSFSASHRYENPQWSPEKNRAVFGACYNPYGHGHNYELEVSLLGAIDQETGMVLNLTTVDAVLKDEIVARFDHRYINKEVEGFSATIPTVENLSIAIWRLLEPRFGTPGCRLYRVRLHESSDLHCEYYGENMDEAADADE